MTPRRLWARLRAAWRSTFPAHEPAAPVVGESLVPISAGYEPPVLEPCGTFRDLVGGSPGSAEWCLTHPHVPMCQP